MLRHKPVLEEKFHQSSQKDQQDGRAKTKGQLEPELPADEESIVRHGGYLSVRCGGRFCKGVW